MSSWLNNTLMEQDPTYLAKVDAQRKAQAAKQFSQLTPNEVSQWQQQWGPGSVMPDMATQQKAWEGQRDFAANQFATSVANRPAPIPNAMSMPSQTPTTGSQPATPASPWDTQPKPMTPTAGTKPDTRLGAQQAQPRLGGLTPQSPGVKPPSWAPNSVMPTTPGRTEHEKSPDGAWYWSSTYGWQPNEMMSASGSGGVPPQQTAGTNAFQLPQGFNVRTGSTDPNDPTGQNQQVYGSNYFPGGLAGFEGVMNAAQFNALSPQQQGDYREALYRQNAGLPAPNQPGSPTAGTKPNSPNYDPLAPATAGNKPNVPVELAGGGPPGGTTPGQPPVQPPGGSQLQPTNQQYQFPNNFSFPAFSYNQVEDYKDNPAYQSQLKDSERALNRRLLSMGRSDSTGGINAFQTNQRQLGAEFEQKAYERAVTEDNNAYARAREQNMTEFDRAAQVNKLLYDRNYQERVLSYEQKFRENERQYGRAKAEEQLAYDRQWNEDAREYSYWKYLVDVGLRAAGAPAT